MSNFTLDIDPAALGVQVELVDWADVGNVGDPNRLNATKYPHRYYRVGFLAPLPLTLNVRCTVGGVAAPLDATLGGKLFIWWWAQRGQGAPPSLIPPAGQSSLVGLTFTPDNLGTWLLCAMREDGGSMLLGISVEVAS